MKALGSIVAGMILVGIWYMPRSGSVNVFAQSKLPEATTAEVSKPAASNASKTSVKRLKIEVEVSSPSEILVEEGQKVTAKQVIVDRKTERTNLTNQLQEVKLSIERLKTSPKVSKVPPASVSTLKNLPKAQYLEESAQLTLPIPTPPIRLRIDLLIQGILEQPISGLSKALSMRRYPLRSITQSLRILLKFVCFLSPSLCQIGTLHILPLFAL